MITFPDLAKLVLRVSVGSVFSLHGSQKLFSAFEGSGINKFADFIGKLGIPYPELNAWLVGGAEFLCGLAIVFGVFARWATLPLIFTMGVAIFYVTGKNGISIAHKEFEYNVVLIATLTSIFLFGSGRFSLRN